MSWLGIDVGTSAVKVQVVDESGGVLGSGSSALRVERPRPGWSEQWPEDWWTATRAAIAQLPAEARRRVQAIGVAGQMHGAVLLDRRQRVLRSAILWNDSRAHRECDVLESSPAGFVARTGNRVLAGFTAPKLEWLRRHEPALFAQVATVLLPKDYVLLKLTGTLATDVSDASGTLWFDVARRQWDATLLEATGLAVDSVPPVFESDAPVGRVQPATAALLGLGNPIVVAGAGDQAAGAIGAGVVRPGQSTLSLGTSGVVFVVTAAPAPAPQFAVHSFCHAVRDRWHQMSVHLSAAACVEWVARLAGFASVEQALLAAEHRAGRAGVPVFLPYLSGERTPHADAHARGVFFGLDYDTDGAALVLGVLEGVAFAIADGVDALAAGGSKIEALDVIGGGERSAFWSRLIASIVGVPLHHRPGAAVGPALGAARLAERGALGSAAPGLSQPPPVRTTLPDAALADRLHSARRRFQRLYRAVAPEFRETVTG